MTTLAQQRWAELITVDPDVALGDGHLKLQRYAFDRAKYDVFTVREMLWHRGRNDGDYIAFLFRAQQLDHVLMTYDIITCHLNGPTIVAIAKTVYAPIQRILMALNRTMIMPQRVF